MSEVRLTAYLHARKRQRDRLDAAPRSRSGKTRQGVKCTPGNKKCGNRCIPQNWNCRITGGGLDSHSKAVEFDPIGGTSSIIRGGKNVIEGYKNKDPEKIARGLKGIERGIVKITPGDDLEQKQRFRKRVRTVANITFLAAATTIGAYQIHQTLKRSNVFDYRNRLGADIDAAAVRAVDRVSDAWDAGVHRIGLGGVFGTGRAQLRAAGASAAGRLSYQGVVRQAAENRLSVPARTSNYLSTRARLRAAGSGISAVHDIDNQARTAGWSFERWMNAKTQALYSLEENGRSVYARPAAHELLARQWGFELDPRPLRQAASGGTLPEMSTEYSRVRAMLPQRIKQMHDDMVADLQRRRFETTPQGIESYTSALIAENPNLIFGRNAADRRRNEQAFRSRVRDVISARTAVEQRTLANTTYNQTVDYYNSFFRDAASRLQLNEDGTPRNPAVQLDSPFGDAAQGLARFHAAQRRRYRTPVGVRTSTQVRYPFAFDNREVGRFLNRHYYHTNVLRDRGPLLFEKPDQVRRIAGLMSGGTFEGNESTQAAIDWFAQNGFGVAIGPRPRGSQRRRPPNTRITRSDAKGKRCGASYIPAAHKCHSGTAPSAPESGKAPKVLANKHNAAYKARQIGSIVARLGAVAGGAVLAVKAGKQGIEEGNWDALAAAGAGAGISYYGVKSLIREKQSTNSPKDLVKRYEKLKQVEGVDPKVVDKLQKFITDTDLDSQRVNTMLTALGMGGYFDSAYPDRIHVTAEGITIDEAYKGKDPAVSYSKGVDKYMRHRASLTKESHINADKAANMETMYQNFSGSHWIANKDGKVDYYLAHEAAHAIHYRSNFASPKAVIVNGKRYEGAELERELMRSTSYYGQSDLRKRGRSKDNYYEQGNRLETYSENFALYVGNAKTMKELFPVSYEWTRQTTEYALSKPPKKEARPFIDIVNELAKGSERFEPRALASRRDAPEDEARILQLLTAIRTAATNGDVPGTLKLFAEAQSLPQEYRFMFGAFLETAFMYSQINQSSGDTL